MSAPVPRFRPPARRAAAALAGLALVGLLAACGQAFVDSRREAGSPDMVGASTPDRPVICYAPAETGADRLLEMAGEVCAETGRVPRYERTERYRCRMMQPHRAIFTCVAPGTAGAGTMPAPRSAPMRAGAGRSTGRGGGVGDWHGGIYPEGRPPQPPRL